MRASRGGGSGGGPKGAASSTSNGFPSGAGGAIGRAPPPTRSSAASESSRLLKSRGGGGDRRQQVPAGGKRVSPHQANPLEPSLREATAGLGFVLFLWCVGLGCVGLRFSGAYGLETSYWVVMLPLWMGDLIGLALGVSALSRTLSLHFSMSPRRAPSTLLQAPTSAGSAATADGQPDQFIAIDTKFVPLAQRFVVASASALLLVLVASVTHLLFCIHLEGSHSLGLLPCMIPVIIGIIFALAHGVLMNSEGPISIAFWSLLLAGVAGAVLKIEGLPPVLDSVDWVYVAIPFWIIDGILLGAMVWVIIKYGAGRYFVFPQQMACLGVYFLSWLFLVEGEISIIAAPPQEQPQTPALPPPSESVWDWMYTQMGGLVCLWLSCCLFCTAFYMAAEYQAADLIETLGFEDPLPLSKTRRGWEPSGGGVLRWSLLGPIEIRHVQGGGAFLRISHLDRGSFSSSTSSINNYSSNADIDVDVGFGGEWERSAAERTDSGRYDDILTHLNP